MYAEENWRMLAEIKRIAQEKVRPIGSRTKGIVRWVELGIGNSVHSMSVVEEEVRCISVVGVRIRRISHTQRAVRRGWFNNIEGARKYIRFKGLIRGILHFIHGGGREGE